MGDGIDLVGRLAGFLGQFAHLVGDHGKPRPASPARACLDGGIEREQVGLVGDVAHFLGHAGDRLRAPDEFIHRAGDFAHVLLDAGDFADQLRDLLRTLGRPFDAFRGLALHILGRIGNRGNGHCQLLHGRRTARHGIGLLFGDFGQRRR
jgi:hypothetical protein